MTRWDFTPGPDLIRPRFFVDASREALTKAAEALRSAIEYIYNNPVQSGLARRPIEWEWSSERFWSGVKNVPLKMDLPYDVSGKLKTDAT